MTLVHTGRYELSSRLSASRRLAGVCAAITEPARASVAVLWYCLPDRHVVVLDVAVGKGYTYSLLPENLRVRGENYAEHT
jgi:hypothetical protein